jgi:hypothetical protein
VRDRRAALVLLLLALAAPCAAALELGTLFTTPEERARLDRLRRGEPDTPVAETSGRALDPVITGFVKRSDGRHTVWIDGSPVQVTRPGAGELLQPNRVGSPGAEDSVKVERKAPR